jgi:osmotically-inducible protein OsmY
VNKRKHVHAWTLVVAFTGVATGCATFEKCGLDGCPGDAKITANVESRFQSHSELGPPNTIDVHTLNRVVYLSGFVSAGEQSSIAESVALTSPGVARVVNSIAVEH